jgi:pimeloyl-ACP methyl ester carboxylesterase
LCGLTSLALAAPDPVPTYGESPCVERVASAASGAAPAPPSRLPELRYECHVMRGGQPLFVGRAGPAGAPHAPVVLLIHGLGQNAHTDWSEAVHTLAPSYQLITVDLPGFGASPPPAGAYSFATLGDQLRQLVERLAPGRRVMVVGHSLGGAVALHFAHRHAALVDRLVLVDAAGILQKQVYTRHLAAQVVPQTGITPVDEVLRHFGGRLRDLSSYIFLGRGDSYDILPLLMANDSLRKALLGGVVQVDAAISLIEQDFGAAIREVAAPTTVIWGSDDRIAPPRTGRILAARMRQAQQHVLAGAGHTPMTDQPAAFNRLLRQALDGPPVPPSPGFNPAASAANARSQGDVSCDNQIGARYSGRIDTLTLNACRNVRIEGARIGRLVMHGSVAQLDDSRIESIDVAIAARDSELIATTSVIQGRTAIRADNSWFDLAGVHLVASDRGLDLRDAPSRVFFSVSDADTPELRGPVHGLWPRGAGR